MLFVFKLLCVVLIAFCRPTWSAAKPSKHVRPQQIGAGAFNRILSGGSEQLWEDIRTLSVPRVVGSEGHSRVANFLENWFNRKNSTSVRGGQDCACGDESCAAETLDDDGSTNVHGQSEWLVEVDSFSSETPVGVKNFKNIVARWLPPDAPAGRHPAMHRHYVVAAHYDGKLFDFGFDAATDSAVPVALILDALRVLDAGHMFDQPRTSAVHHRVPARGRQKRQREAKGEESTESASDLPGLTIVFFDGEEAFGEWTDTDSIYGARHLSALWQETKCLDQIDALILLDLLGGSAPKIYSYHESTSWLFEHLRDVERRVIGAQQRQTSFVFQPQPLYNSGLQDDHIPFLQREVPILHLMPVPFPKVWHTQNDNVAHLDRASVDHWRRILPLFFAELLHLELPVG